MKTHMAFTDTDYPNGYSRRDAERQLAMTESSLELNKTARKRLEDEAKQLRRELKQGGRDALC